MTGASKTPRVEPGRMAALARLPLFFSLRGKRVVVAGGSAAAAWKAELLSAAGAEVAVYADEISVAMKRLAATPPGGAIALHPRSWTAADLSGAAVAIGDFDDEERAADFRRAARGVGVPVNIVDRPAFCDFSFGAIVNRSPLVVGISTDGAAPAFAQAIRGKLEALLPTGFADWAVAAARWREAVKQSRLSQPLRRKFWQHFAALALRRADRPPHARDFDRLIAGAGGDSTERGAVTYVRVDPDHPDLLTLRAIRALQAADVILFDDQVPHEALDFARREARKILVGPAEYDGQRRPYVDTLSADFANQGQRVVLVASQRRADSIAAGIRERLSSAA
jgi:uroporphyrin-III C-methyltransferase/precorrin-2 dehydrogenase/sirohydrochlorin ferrochelatase